MTSFKRVLLIGIVASTFAACSSNKPPKPAPQPPMQEVVTVTVTSYFNSIWFDHNSTKISDEYAPVLKINADYLNSNPLAMIQIQGNASEIGSKEHNQKLSLARAKAVTAKLISMGVNSKQIQEVSFGATKPTYPSDKKGHSPQNRRVDIIYISRAPVSYYIDQVPIVSTEDETVDFQPVSVKGQKQVTHPMSSAPANNMQNMPSQSGTALPPPVAAPATQSNQANSQSTNGSQAMIDALPSN